jgi:nicotinamide-nucleotide amidase
MNNDLVIKAAQLLINCGYTMACAESATAGRLTSEFSLVNQAGLFLKGGIVCYDANVKTELLQVSQNLIDRYTAESMEVTKAITIGISKIINANIHIGITGLTAPGGSETVEKPVGTMFIYAIKNGVTIFSERLNFKGTPEFIVAQTINHIAENLIKYLPN